MNHTWQLQEAKNKLSEVVLAAETKGPQVITRRGEEAAVVLSTADYRRLLVSKKKLSEFFHESPLVGMDLNLARNIDPVRGDVEL